MKRLAPTLAVIFLSLFAVDNIQAQKAIYTSPGGLSIGFGGGASYQTSDIANSRGFGADFILGSPIYQRENAFFSVDWKFRFLGGQNRAYDHRINADDTYSNIRYNFFSYDVEFGLTLNRLRERTRIIVSGFAGLGLTHGRTAMDLYDESDNLYDFSGIDPNRNSKEVYHDLRVLSDNKFETKISNKLALLPTAGLYLGYQFSRSFALGVEFKTNFNLTEYNSFTGIDIDNRDYSGSGWDRNNYISLGFRWQLGRGGSYGRSNSYSSAPVTYTDVVSVSAQPSVQIIEPALESTQTTIPNQTIRANIANVSGPGDIRFFQNGFPVNTFTYNASSGAFVSNVRLQEGENDLRIQAGHQTSMAEDQVFITLGPAETYIPAPEVEFTSPSARQHITTAEQLVVNARVQNVGAKEDIQLSLNGRDIPFEFYPVSGTVKATVQRSRELSNLMIIGFNQSGSSQDELSIEFTEPGVLATPMVRFVNPPVPMEVEQNIFPLSAETFNVPGPNDVSLTINGNHIRNFSFNAYGEVKAGILLLEGINTIDISVRNGAGEATERTYINYYPLTYHVPVYNRPVYQEPVQQPPVVEQPVYREPVVVQPVNREPVVQEPMVEKPVYRERPKEAPVANRKAPVIRIINPNADPYSTYEQSEDLRATVLNVISKENIILKINGLSTRDFSFNLRTKEVTARINLREGENLVVIQAQNEAGGDREDQVIIHGLRPCPAPLITLMDPGRDQINTNQQDYVVKANIRNVTSTQQLSLKVNGQELSYSLDNQVLVSPVSLVSGANTLSLTAVNECGEDRVSARINYSPDVVEEPCSPPKVEMDIKEVQRQDASHELTGIISHVKNKASISLSLDGKVINGYQFRPETGQLKAKFKLKPGSHNIVVYVNNDCGTDSKTASVIVRDDDDGGDDPDNGSDDDDACGIRINPGNSAWQFCLVTPAGIFNRDNLTNSSFSYSGPASSLFFLPIAGGGNATVDGRPYAVRSGQYYLFTGGLNVSVSTQNPGSMGQWSICISANNSPVSGNGNNRPQSPCETEKVDPSKGKDNPSKGKDDPSKGKNDPPKEKDNGSKGNNDRKKSNEVSPQGNEVSPTKNNIRTTGNQVRSTGNQSRSSGNQVRSTGTQSRSRTEVRSKESNERQSTQGIRKR